jgi:hypothetical protein
MCVCICVCIGVYVWKKGCNRLWIYVGKHECMYMCMYKCVCMNGRMCEVMDVCRKGCVYVYVYV